MTSVDDFERWNGMKFFTERQRSAAAFLEAKGLRFLCEYGYENCESIAEAHGWNAPDDGRLRPVFRQRQHGHA